MRYVQSPSRYKLARALLGVWAVIGWGLIILGILIAAVMYKDNGRFDWPMLILPLSGLFILISNQFARAALDTADSTRRIHELLALTLADTVLNKKIKPSLEPEVPESGDLNIDDFGPAKR